MFWRAIALMVAAGVSGMAHAHEFIAKPGGNDRSGGCRATRDGKGTDIAIKPNEKTLAYDGTVIAPTSATFIITGGRLPQIWATTPEGLKQITGKTAGATNPYKIREIF